MKKLSFGEASSNNRGAVSAKDLTSALNSVICDSKQMQPKFQIRLTQILENETSEEQSPNHQQQQSKLPQFTFKYEGIDFVRKSEEEKVKEQQFEKEVSHLEFV